MMMCIKESLLWPLIYADVIHIQELRKLRRVIGVARPSAANRQIQDNEKRMVEDPLIGDIRGRELEILLIIKIPADLVLLPLDGINMEIILQ